MCLIDLCFVGDGLKLMLVGKGVCFDIGGLDIKLFVLMGLMKKDMGGVVNVLGLVDMLVWFGLMWGM